MTEKIRNRKRMKLDRSFMFRKFRKELEEQYGPKKAAAIWRYAEHILQKLEAAEPDADKNSRSSLEMKDPDFRPLISDKYAEIGHRGLGAKHRRMEAASGVSRPCHKRWRPVSRSPSGVSLSGLRKQTKRLDHYSFLMHNIRASG